MCGRAACSLGAAEFCAAVARCIAAKGAAPGCVSYRAGGAAPAGSAQGAAATGGGKAAESACGSPRADEPRLPNYNIAPAQRFPVLCPAPGGGVELRNLRWGFDAPFKGPGQLVINARSETVQEKAMFRRPFCSSDPEAAHGRCVAFFSGFYEWHKAAGGKQPYFCSLRDGLMAVACLRSTSKEHGEEFVALTVPAARDLEWLHDRMPAILTTADAVSLWLSWGSEPSPKELAALLRPLDGLSFRKVSPQVGSIRNNSAELLLEWAPPKPASSTKTIDQFFRPVGAKSPAAAAGATAGSQPEPGAKRPRLPAAPPTQPTAAERKKQGGRSPPQRKQQQGTQGDPISL
eukprot:TRINITY_DN20459_c0_g1_i1.p1 TRINITY_DN20459_c0_g1~~TRINITY_DN20459_c0_g1_i1.p1  ORF type:complete len:347 (+),score=94.34 TRINITY_DN20459_c0_g1_i1:69-1109(+)